MSLLTNRLLSRKQAPGGGEGRGRLFRKYVALFGAVVAAALAINGASEIWFSYREQNSSLIRIQRTQAEAAAASISHFVNEIEGQMGWMTQLPWEASSIDEWRFDAVRLLRQVPAITELSWIDGSGHERVRMSRLAEDVIGSGIDFSGDPKFREAMANRHYYGLVYFRRDSEPYMTLSVAGSRRSDGVIAAEVNLRFIWDVVSAIKVGTRGRAYVVDASGRLIAHPDNSLVLRNTDMSQLAQVEAARRGGPEHAEQGLLATDISGTRVLAAYAPLPSLGWFLFTEAPISEAYAPLYSSILRSIALIAAALAAAVMAGLLLARRMVIPIQALRDGAARIGSGDLAQRISIRTGDELEALGDQFNSMAAQLQDSYATLERKVDERTHELALANQAKSRFLAAASHDLRQPLHALGLFVAQLRSQSATGDKGQIVERIDTAVAAMNELFNALLDISKLDAGVLTPNYTEFPILHLLRRIESTFAGMAREKGLSLRIVPTSAWVRSDAILLERILINLVSNAVRYTSRGGVVVGCRRRDGILRIEVWDSGAGIPEDQRKNIFGEFYRITDAGRDQRGGVGGGLGLGLAIVDRLGKLLDHPIALASRPGKGTRFSVSAPLCRPGRAAQPAAAAPLDSADVARGKLIVVIDDDPLVLDGTGGLLRSWGSRVVAGATDAAVTQALRAQPSVPDLIISDYRLPDGKNGIEAIDGVRKAFGQDIPAFLISGDTDPELLRQAQSCGFHLVHKPVQPMTLRAMLQRMIRKGITAPSASVSTTAS
jgi:signal transduction histidine kinase/CheY-like chemotaxis protein